MYRCPNCQQTFSEPLRQIWEFSEPDQDVYGVVFKFCPYCRTLMDIQELPSWNEVKSWINRRS